MTADSALTSGQLCARTGLAYRTLDGWCRHGLLTPSVREGTGKGGDRLFGAADLLAARYLLALQRGAGRSGRNGRKGWRIVTDVLSYGGGRQSVAMCLLALHEVLPRPDYVLMADTGREARSTFDYLDAYVRPALAKAKIDVHIAPHSLATVDLHGKNGDLLLPVYTATGKLSTWCSGEWKAAVNERYLRSLGVRAATSWIGFTLDEKGRVKGHGESPWWRSYPLIERVPMTRTDCERLIETMGWPLPAKSACWMCPHRNNAEWRHIRDTEPDHWQEAVALDQELRDEDERGGVYLHQSRVPLAVADLDASDRREPSRQCALGLCMV